MRYKPSEHASLTGLHIADMLHEAGVPPEVSGVGHSGLGLTLSTYGIQVLTRPKAWHLRGA